MRKYITAWVLLFGIVFLGAGTVMLNQGYRAQLDIKANVAAENINLGMAERKDGSKDEAVAKLVPAEYQGKPLAEAKLPDALMWQREVIREHTLTSTKGLTFAEMPRMIPKLDEAGNQIIGEDGKPIMVLNTARDIWTQSTALQGALLQGYTAWKISELVMGLGALFVFMGLSVLLVGLPLSRKAKT